MRGKPLLSFRKLRFLITVILCGVISAGLYSIIRFGFNVTNIEFVGVGMDLEINDRMMTGNTIFFPSEKLRLELIKDYPQLKDVIIQKKFPHTIVIIPVLRKPYARLVTESAEYGIDEMGAIVGVGTSDPGLPELEIDASDIHVGTIVENRAIRSALSFLVKSKGILDITKVQTSDDGLSLRAISDKTEILFTQESSLDTLMATLQTITSGVRIKGIMPKVIDLRFSKPVIQW